MITNLKKDEVYIGASSDIKRRWSNHLAKMRNGNHIYPTLNKAYKIDINNIKFEILEECESYELAERDNYYIEYMKKSRL